MAKEEISLSGLDMSAFPDKYVALLASMCMVCEPSVFKRGFLGIRRVYGYYIPSSETDLNIAKALFANNGIKMQVHNSKIINYMGQDVLRVSYNRCVDSQYAYNFMRRVEQKHIFLYTKSGLEEKRLLNQKVAELKEMYKGR